MRGRGGLFGLCLAVGAVGALTGAPLHASSLGQPDQVLQARQPEDPQPITGAAKGGGGKPPTRTPSPTRTGTPTSAPATSTPAHTATPPPMWRPALQTSWQIQFTGALDTTVAAQMYDLDMFDTPAATVGALKAGGKRVVCYISAGSWEEWRPDAGLFPAVVKGNTNGWPGEHYLDIRRVDILGPLMQARLDLCKSKGFDAVDFDNVDTYSHPNTGFPLSYSDQLAYNRYLADAAHARGLSAGLKNDLSQVTDLLPWFDWAINEQCYAYNECHLLLPFVQAGKAVFIIEYDTPSEVFCPLANGSNFNGIRKRVTLDAWRDACR